MKKIFKILGALLLLLMVAAVTVPFLIPAETYKKEITRVIYERTGRTIEIAGQVSASVYPTIGARLEGVTLSNGKGFSEKPMLKLKEMNVEVALMPLLQKQVQVQKFILENPIIELEVNKQGKPNWEFAPIAAAPAQEKAALSFDVISRAEAQEEAPAEDSAAMIEILEKLQIGVVQINHGTLNFVNHQTGVKQGASDINLTFGLKNLDDPFVLKGSAVWNKEKISVDAKLDNPRQLLKTKSADVVANIASSMLDVDFSGKATPASVQGALSLNTPSIPKLTGWTTGTPMAWKGPGALALNIKGQLACSATLCGLKQSNIDLDSLKLAGDIGALLGGKAPKIQGNLSTPLLDINAFMPAQTASNDVLFGLVSSAHAAPASGWSNDPIDLSGLGAVNAAIKFSADAIKFNQIDIGKSVFDVALNNGALALDIVQMGLYQGNAKGTITATTGNAVGVNLSASGINAASMLKALTGDDRLSGTLVLNMALNMAGSSQRAMISSLGGNGNAKFTDGALKGINIAQMVRDAKAAVLQQQNTSQKTDFAELGGSFTIANGVVTNKDLSMKAPVLRLNGEGQVNLPQMTVNYRLLPKLIASIEGQGGADDKKGLVIPIIVEGPLTSPSYRPDLASMVQDALKNPEQLKENLKNLKGEGKAIENAVKAVRDNPKENLGNLIQGLGGLR